MSKTKVTVKTPDFGRFKKALDDLRNKTGLKIVENAVNNAPVDTGNYRSEIRYDGANTVTANAKYSAAIEYGFEHYEEKVSEHQRVITKAFGKKLKNAVIADVKAHTRTINRKPNPVMRSAAATVQKQIPQIWKEAQKENGL